MDKDIKNIKSCGDEVKWKGRVGERTNQCQMAGSIHQSIAGRSNVLTNAGIVD